MWSDATLTRPYREWRPTARISAVLSRRTTNDRRWILAGCSVAVLAGAAASAASLIAFVPFVVAGAILAFLVPLEWLAAAAVAAGLTFRAAAPTASGPIAYVPDAIVAIVCLRVAAQCAIEGAHRLPRGFAVSLLALSAFVAIAVGSMLINRDAPLALIGSIRQFVRYPALAIALAFAGITWRQVRTMLVAILAISLIELPLALMQHRHPVSSAVIPGVTFFSGDNVSGTFGYGGNSEDMLYLVICSCVWLALAMQHVVRPWTLLVLAPVMVVPMALGSSASFVLFLPLAVISVAAWTVIRRLGRISPAVVVLGGVAFIAIAWSAGSLALAPGLDSGDQSSARTVLSGGYLSSYVASTASTSDPSTRLGFLRFAMEADTRSGVRGVLLGQGPAVSFIGPRNAAVTNSYLVSYPILQVRSVQSLQRTLLGYGFGAALLYVIALLAPAIAVLRSRPGSPGRRAAVLALPAAALVVVLGGVYNAAWTDPGVAAAYWTLALAATVAASQPRAADTQAGR
jgi:hypothetical protein